jgi:hypothetical protein
LVYTAESVSARIHHLFGTDDKSSLSSVHILFCTECVFIFFIISSFLAWHGLVQLVSACLRINSMSDIPLVVNINRE